MLHTPWPQSFYSRILAPNRKELVSFIEQLSSAQFQKIEEFFATMPKLQYKTNVKNPNTDVENEVVLEGLASFFS